jgi:hypothetical protein
MPEPSAWPALTANLRKVTPTNGFTGLEGLTIENLRLPAVEGVAFTQVETTRMRICPVHGYPVVACHADTRTRVLAPRIC